MQESNPQERHKKRWVFADSVDTGVYTTKRVMSGEDDVTRVFHDAEDGAWQFHGPGESSAEDAVLVCLEHIIDRDCSIEELADLPTGWCAWRDDKSSRWIRDLQEEESAESSE